MTPLTQTKLLSFKDNFKELVNLSLRNKLPNKLIFSGNKGIGKSTFAFHLINYLFSQDEEGSYNLEDNEIDINNKSYKLVSNNTHPNLLLVESIDKKLYTPILSRTQSPLNLPITIKILKLTVAKPIKKPSTWIKSLI